MRGQGSVVGLPTGRIRGHTALSTRPKRRGLGTEPYVPAFAHSRIRTSSRMRGAALEVDQRALAVEAPTVAAQFAGAADHAVAGDRERDRVRRAGEGAVA